MEAGRVGGMGETVTHAARQSATPSGIELRTTCPLKNLMNLGLLGSRIGILAQTIWRRRPPRNRLSQEFWKGAIMRSIRLACLIAVLLAAAPCGARFRLPEIEQVPVDRLIRNLEAEVDGLTDSGARQQQIADTRRKLARVHALASARGTTTLNVMLGTNIVQEPPGRGYLQSLDDRGERSDNAAAHLASAIAIYEAIVQFDRYDIRSRLGLAWALDQSGREREALEQYRLVAAAAWPIEESSITVLYADAMTIFQEAATAVVRYLDADADAAEIGELERRLATFDDIGRAITPILVPLDADDAFATLVDPNADIAFDLDGSGLARRWGWITPRAAWLVWDPEGSGRIDSGLQLFGSISFFTFWANGYEALSALDDDRDGKLAGAELDGLALWADADSDGGSDPGEVRPIAAHGIVSISTTSQRHPRGFQFNPVGLETVGGSTRATYDWIARASPIS